MNKQKVIKLSEYLFDKITGTFTGLCNRLMGSKPRISFLCNTQHKKFMGTRFEKNNS